MTMKLNEIRIFFGLILLSSGLCAQIPILEWEHSYGGNDEDVGECVIIGKDNGYIVAGYSYSSDGDVEENKGGSDIVVFKITEEGEILWRKNYGGTLEDRCYKIISAIDDGYILVGDTYSNDGDFDNNYGEKDICIIKIDEEGNILWSRTYGGTSGESAITIIPTSDNNYLIASASASNDEDVSGNHSDQNDFWILKIDIDGDILWQKCFGSNGYDLPYAANEVSDGYLLFGYASEANGDVSLNHGGVDCWLLKINFYGDIIFQKSYGGSLTDVGHALITGESGKFYCAGTTYSNDGDITLQHGASDCWMLCIDSLGNLLNQKTLGGSQFEDGFDLIKINDEFIVAGESVSYDGDISENKGGADYLFASFDSLFNLNWEKTVGGSQTEIAQSIIESTDNNLLAVGYSFSSDFDVTESYSLVNFWVVKLKFCLDQYFADIDGDGFGNLFSDSLACDLPLGYVPDSTDCDDANTEVFPSAEDICNAIDDNCNGIIDEDAIEFEWFLDNDGDSFGNMEIDTSSCFSLEGYVLNNTDCDDANNQIYPSAPELLNGLDDNCNDLIDEGLEIENLNTVTIIYPNPTQDILSVELNTKENVKIEIMTMLAQTVIVVDNYNSGDKINIRSLSPGIYLIQVIFKENIVVDSFTKN